MNEVSKLAAQEKEIQAISDKYLKQIKKLYEKMADEMVKVFSDSSDEQAEH